MTLEERIKQLKSDLEELNKELDKSESAFTTSENFMALTTKLDFSKPDNRETTKSMMKEYVKNEIIFLRTQIELIRRISIETANYLDNEVSQYEKACKNFFIYWDDLPNSQTTPLQILTNFANTMNEVNMSYRRLHEMIKLCRDSIRDTVKRLEPPK
ncbi:MAG: hypothetical protein HY295_03630 [Thaumarchaeota archaeon]|nr:hypothetical protein [Nitrososphaerota archaeon]